MRVEAIIPARYGSQRLAGKPLADICGKPMVRWVYERASAAALVDAVTVATDDERVARAVESFGGSVVMTSAAHASGTDRVAEAASMTDAEIIVNVQGDEPFITPEAIDAAVAPLMEDQAMEVCTLKTPIRDMDEYRDPNVVKVVTDSRGYALYFSRSPIPHARVPFDAAGLKPFKHIGLYVFRRGSLMRFSSLGPARIEACESLEQLRALYNGMGIRVVETAYDQVSVDTPDDLERARAMARTAGAVAGRAGSGYG
jgi:3-deoxy-manno-octulosonate cytidylyltransferase (CMP-KDO synthetase)